MGSVAHHTTGSSPGTVKHFRWWSYVSEFRGQPLDVSPSTCPSTRVEVRLGSSPGLVAVVAAGQLVTLRYNQVVAWGELSWVVAQSIHISTCVIFELSLKILFKITWVVTHNSVIRLYNIWVVTQTYCHNFSGCHPKSSNLSTFCVVKPIVVLIVCSWFKTHSPVLSVYFECQSL